MTSTWIQQGFRGGGGEGRGGGGGWLMGHLVEGVEGGGGGRRVRTSCQGIGFKIGVPPCRRAFGGRIEHFFFRNPDF